MNIKNFTLMLLLFFATPMYSNTTSQPIIQTVSQTQQVENNISQQRVDAIEEGIFRSISSFIGTKIIIPIIMSFWDIIVVMFSFLWVFIAPFIPWILGLIVLAGLFMG